MTDSNQQEAGFCWSPSTAGASQVALVVKNPPASAGAAEDAGSILGQENPLEEGTATHLSLPA